MRQVDCSYTVTEEQLREYAKIPEIERLRWLDEMVRFTRMFQEAPLADPRAPAARSS